MDHVGQNVTLLKLLDLAALGVCVCVCVCVCVSAAISLRLQGKLSFPYNCQKMNGQIYVLLC